MDKIATLVKEAEVRGVLAGLVDGGHLKLASYEELDAFTEAVASMLPDNSYGLEDVLNKTAELIEYIESGDMEKEASEELDETALMAAFGELTMMKMAGQIDDYTFEKEAASIKGLIEGGKNLAKDLYSGDVKSGVRSYLDAMKFKDFRAGREGVASANKELKKVKNLMSNIRDPKQRAEAIKDGAADAILGRMYSKEQRNSGLRKSLGAYGATALGVGGAAYGGKALYDKYKK